MSADNIGKIGEDAAARELLRTGYKITERNYRTRSGEIDIIAEDADGAIVFTEVKTRSGTSFGRASDSVGAAKRERLYKTALEYLESKSLFERDSRFDIIEVYYKNDRGLILIRAVNHIKNAFEAE